MELQLLPQEAYIQTLHNVPPHYYRHPLIGRAYRERITHSIDLLPTGEHVLEVGYGSGTSFLNLASRFRTIHGVDLHNRPGEVLQAFAGRGLDLDLRQGNVLQLPYADASMDAALAISIHEHIAPSKQAQAFAEIHRVLKPGGAYVVGVPGVHILMTLAFYALGWKISEQHICTERQVLAAMRSLFEVDYLRYTPRYWPRRFPSYVYIRGRKRA